MKIIRNMPLAEYHASDALSHSALLAALKSPEHFLQYRNGIKEPTPAMEFGTAAHFCILEPEYFAQNYVLAPKFDRRTKEGKEAAAKWEAENAGKTALTPEQMEALTAMRDSVFRHAGAAKLLAKGEAETSLFWTDEATGLECRIRPDWWCDGVIADIKTCCDAEKNAFSKAIASLGYDVQAAFYVDGMKEVTGKTVDFIFLAVEKNPPYTVACYKASEEVLEVGRAKYRGALQLLKWCHENNKWPGYQPNGEIEEINLPRWATINLED